jgi:hypothetical protein
MHLLTSLILISGFVFVYCLRVVKVIWDLSEMSAHVPPMPAMPCGRFLEADRDMRTRLKSIKKDARKLWKGEKR